MTCDEKFKFWIPAWVFFEFPVTITCKQETGHTRPHGGYKNGKVGSKNKTIYMQWRRDL